LQKPSGAKEKAAPTIGLQEIYGAPGSGVARVAIARKLAVRLYWKLREAVQPVASVRMQGSPVGPVVGEGLSPN